MPKAGIYDFPSYDLEHVIDKLRTVYDTLRIDEMDRGVVAETMHMAVKGGGFASLISALEKYNLIETAWGGNITITELGKLATFAIGDEQKRAKSKAVSNIPLFRELFSKYGLEASEEQIRAFLRQEANVDVTKAQRVANQVHRIYKNVAIHIEPIESPELVTVSEPAGIDRSEDMVPPTVDGEPPLKIQYGGVYIQIPPNDLKAIALAKQALEFMESVMKKEKEN